MSALSSTDTDESHEDTIADLIDLEVYTISGEYVGLVEDVRVEFGNSKMTGLALTEVNPKIVPRSGVVQESRGVIIPFRWIHSVGDVVIVNNVFERLKSVQSSSE